MRGFLSIRASALVLAVFALGLFSSAALAETYFYNQATFPTGNRPGAVAIADFNGDGRMDVAVANGSDNTISIMLGTPDGTLAAKNDIPTSNGPEGIVAADFNGDGKMDLAITSFGNTVSIWLGNGDGTFQSESDYPTGNYPFAITVADFNNDGKVDLAIGNSNCFTTCGAGSVSILLGNGDGTFQPKIDYATASRPVSVIAADFNRDGKLDLAVACFYFTGSSNSAVSRVSILVGNGDGMFQSNVDYAADYAIEGVAAADFNGDGKLDLVVGSDPPDLLFGNGDGTFQAAQQVPLPLGEVLSPIAIQTADLNHDGKMDFIAATVGGVSVFLGKGDGTFQSEQDYAANPGQGSMALADVNGDGALDAVLTDWSGGGTFGNTVTVLLGNGNGTFSPRVTLPVLPSLPQPYNPGQFVDWTAERGLIADFNGDGKPDLLVDEINQGYLPNGSAVVFFPGNGDGTLGTPVLNNLAGSALVAADFNGDGKLDLVLQTSTGAALALGQGDGTFSAPVPFYTGVGPRSAVTGDFNNDGHMDVAISQNADAYNPPVIVYLGNGDGTFRSVPFSINGTQLPEGMATGDFNRDGKLDLVVGGASQLNNIAIYLGNGDGTFQAPVLYTADSDPMGIAVADFNGDGNPDLAAMGLTANIFLGNGNGTFQAPVYYNAGSGPTYVVTGDFDGDGKVDLAVANDINLSILRGKGDGTFQPAVSVNDSSFLYPPATGDLNQDGITDVYTGYGSGSIFLSRPLVSIFPGNLAFAPQSMGTQSTPATVTLTNVGMSGLSVSNVVATGPFGVTSNCASKVSREGTCAVDVTFSPAQPGPAQGTLSFTDNTAVGSHAIPLSGIGGVPTADLSTSGLTFPGQAVGTASSAQTVTVTNSGTWALSISSITVSGDFSQQDTCGSSVAEGSNCTISVTFNPNAGGSRTGTLKIEDDAPNSPQIVTLTGMGNGPAVRFSSPLVFAPQTVGTTSAVQTATLTNTGNANLTLAAIAATSPFSVVNSGTTCSTSIPVAATASCSVAVAFAPTAGGPQTGALQFTDNLPTSPQALVLSGTGLAPAVSFSVPGLTFVGQFVGTTSSPQSVTLTNTGNAALSLGSITPSGDFAQTNNCGSTVATSGTCTINVTFTPSASGLLSGYLTFADNAVGSPQYVSLTGIAVAPMVSFSAKSLAFAGQLVGSSSSAQVLTLSNTGNTALTLTSVAATGDFAQTNNCGSSVAPGSGCAINVTFHPTATGSRTGSVAAIDNAAGSPQTIALTGTGVAPVAGLSVTSLTFAEQPVGSTSGAKTVTLSNTGSTALALTSVAASGDFAQTNSCGTSLAASGTCTISVTFTPTAAGTRTGAITLTDNAADSPQAVGLTGTGLGAVASISPASLTFTGQLIDSTSTAKSLTLTNSGGAALTITGIAASGDFAQTNTCGTSLAVNASCTIDATFTPTAGGSRTGAITLTDNAAASPQAVALTGTGEDFTLTVPSGSSSTASVSAGQTATYSLSFGGLGGINQAINFTCTGAPSEAACTVNPPSATPSGSGAIAVSVSVTTTATSFAAPNTRHTPPLRPGPLWSIRFMLALLLGLLALQWVAVRRKGSLVPFRKFRWGWAIAANVALLLLITACGGGGGGGGPVPNPGTPAGTYTLTITGIASGSSALKHSTTLTLKVS